MILKLLVLMMALVGMVTASGAGHRLPRDGDADIDGHTNAYGHGEDDPDAGWRGFGKVVFGVTVIATIIIVVVLILMFLSLGGVFEDEVADPAV